MAHGDDEFQAALLAALNHLYDPDRLRHSPLLRALDLPDSAAAPARLQQILLDAIHAMKPLPSEPVGSIRRRVYSVLQLRYEQQFSQKEVAAQLGLGVRQYRRVQQNALHTLALRLMKQFAHSADAATPVGAGPADELPETLQWISKLATDEIARVEQVLRNVLILVQPLALRHGKVLVVEDIPATSAAAHPLVLRQALLALLNAFILHGSGDKLTVRVIVERQTVMIRILSQAIDAMGVPVPPALTAELAMARKMLEYYGGSVRTSHGDPAGSFATDLCCRDAATVPVLVVDDHEDSLALLQRYMEGTSYSIVTVSNPQETLELAAAHQPWAIVLDVMMPEMDGWEVLGLLKQDPRTAHVPVLVCTVLDQSELALSLGASAFLRKPVTRPDLLAALDAHGVPSEPRAA